MDDNIPDLCEICGYIISPQEDTEGDICAKCRSAQVKTVETVVTMIDIARDTETEWNRVFMCEWLKNEILQFFKVSPEQVKIVESVYQPKEK